MVLLVTGIGSLGAQDETCNKYGIGKKTVGSSRVWYPRVGGEDTGAPVEGAPRAEASFPIIVFGHGTNIPINSYDYLWKHLVPAGYVVAMPIWALIPGQNQQLADAMIAAAREVRDSYGNGLS